MKLFIYSSTYCMYHVAGYYFFLATEACCKSVMQKIRARILFYFNLKVVVDLTELLNVSVVFSGPFAHNGSDASNRIACSVTGYINSSV